MTIHRVDFRNWGIIEINAVITILSEMQDDLFKSPGRFIDKSTAIYFDDTTGRVWRGGDKFKSKSGNRGVRKYFNMITKK